jgi:hypothetical protein
MDKKTNSLPKKTGGLEKKSATLKKNGIDPARMQMVDEYAREWNDRQYNQALNTFLNGVVQDYDELNDDPTWQALTVELDNIAQQRPNARVGSGDVDAAALRVLHNKYKTLKTQNEDPEVLYAKVQGNPDMMKRLEQDWLKARMKETPATLGTAASAQPAFTPIEEPPTDEKGARSFAVNLIRKLGIAK